MIYLYIKVKIYVENDALPTDLNINDKNKSDVSSNENNQKFVCNPHEYFCRHFAIFLKLLN